MTAARGLLLLAMVAALMGAPPVASAAANALVAAQVTPPVGTTTTEFDLRVTYDGQSDALAVRASVAGRVLDMSRVSGTAAAGTWGVRTTLPPGTWAVVFTATVERGNAPTLSGPTLSVLLAQQSPPTVETTEPADVSPVDPPVTPDQRAPETDAPATPDEPAAPVEGTTDHEPDTLPASTPPPGARQASPAASEEPMPVVGDDVVHDAPSEQAAPAAGAPSGRPAPAADDETEPEPEPEPGSGTAADDQLAMVLLIGLASVAVVALAGTAFLLVTRRARQTEMAQATGADAPVAAEGPRAVGPTGASGRQALRRARLRMTDDPIMAALGIDEDAAARRARRRADAGARESDGSR